uniref:Uncharacterized protein n=1 Tax=Acrobeloides nanus TaxID=290746 RepID=A0A914EC14_9BILA
MQDAIKQINCTINSVEFQKCFSTTCRSLWKKYIEEIEKRTHEGKPADPGRERCAVNDCGNQCIKLTTQECGQQAFDYAMSYEDMGFILKVFTYAKNEPPHSGPNDKCFDIPEERILNDDKSLKAILKGYEIKAKKFNDGHEYYR